MSQQFSEIVTILFIFISQAEFVVAILVFSSKVYCVRVDLGSIANKWNTVFGYILLAFTENGGYTRFPSMVWEKYDYSPRFPPSEHKFYVPK